jgi:hypothetical protein
LNPRIAGVSARLLRATAQSRERPASANCGRATRETAFTLITADNFKAFREPPRLNVRLTQAAIACAIASFVHDRLFETMTSLFAETKPCLTGPNVYSIFYTAWFKQIATLWDLTGFMAFARLGAIDSFVANISPPPLFLYYLQLFHTIVKDLAILSDLFVECFIRPLVTYAIEYGLQSRLSDLNKTEFVKAFAQREDYRTLLNSFLLAEAYYSVRRPDHLELEIRLTLTYLSSRPPATEFLSAQVASRWTVHLAMKEPPILEWNTLKALDWIVPIGKSTNGADAFLVAPHKLPDLSYDSVLFHFFYHFSDTENPIDLFIDGGKFTPALVDKIAKFVTTVTPDFAARVQRIVIVGISKASVLAIRKIDADAWAAKVTIVNDDLDKFLGNDAIYLEPRLFRSLRCPVAIPVGSAGGKMRISVSQGEMLLIGKEKLFGKIVDALTVFPFPRITQIEDRGDSVVITQQDDSVTIETTAGKFILSTWRFYQPDVERTVTDLELSGHTLRTQGIALALSLLAAKGTNVANALELFEAAIGDRGVAHCAIRVPPGTTIPVAAFIPDIMRCGLLDDVALCLCRYLDSECLSDLVELLPLFRTFLNTSVNRCNITFVVQTLLNLSLNEKVLVIFESFLWPDLASALALDCLVPAVLASSVWPFAVRRTLMALRRHNAEALGNLIVNRCLDGAVRRIVFGHPIPVDRLFACIRALPFSEPGFVISVLPRLLVCAILGGIYANQETADNAKQFRLSALETFERTRLTLNATIGRSSSCESLDSAPASDALLLILNVYEGLFPLSETVASQFLTLITTPEPGDRADIWLVKAAALVYFKGGDRSTALRFMSSLPAFLLSRSGFQKVSLALSSVALLIPTFPPSSTAPLLFFWPALLTATHSSAAVRGSALSLLGAVIPFALAHGGFADISGLHTTRFASAQIDDSVAAFEDSLGANFTKNFAHALTAALTRALAEPDTRAPALRIARACIAGSPRAVYYALPFVAYGYDDCAWVIAAARSDCATIAEFLFDERPPAEAGHIITFLAGVYGDRHCARRAGLIGECLLLGAARFPRELAKVRNALVAKAWRVLDADALPGDIAVTGEFIARIAPIPGLPARSSSGRLRCDDTTLSMFLTGVADGVAGLIRSDLGKLAG